MTGGYAAVRLRTAQLKKAHRALEQKVRERSAALEQARAEAIAATRSKSAFLATLSHEIRTPMNAIVGFAQLGSELCRPAGPRGYFIKIAQASQILLALLNDILDFSKIEAGKLQLEAIPFSLTTLCQETLALFEQDAAARGLLLHAELAPDLPTVRGDPLRLQQILMNLLGNALKFTERGAIVLALRVVHERPDTLTAELSVCDSGRGIAPEVLGGLFEDFAQGPADTPRRYGGTGLGLAIVRRLIDAMGGTLHVVSTLGAGNRFSLELTWPRCEPAPSCKSAALVFSPGQRRRLVEDHPLNQEIAATLLRLRGLEIGIAPDGASALHLLREQRFDAVLMDVHMPGMDGVQCCRQIRQTLKLAALPIIAMTAHVTTEQRQRCLAAGMNGFLAKPIDPAELMALLGQWLACEPGAAHASDPSEPPELPGLALAAALRRLACPLALYRRWLAEFLREFAHGVAHIADLLSAQQWGEAEDRLHSLSGVAGNLGLIALQAEANRQERLLRHGQREALDVARLQAVFEASCTSAAKWLASPEFESEFESECEPEAPAPAPASTSREHLLGQLKRADPRAEQSLQALQGHLPPALYHALRADLRRYDFMAALQRLGEPLRV